MNDQLHNSVKQLNRLCNSPHVIRQYTTREDSIADWVN